MPISDWLAGGQRGAKCQWLASLPACFVWKLLLSVSALKFYSKAPMIQFLLRVLSTYLHMRRGRRSVLKGSNADGISRGC